MKSLFTILFSLSFISFAICQSANTKDCKASLQVDAIFETEEKLHYVFTGADTSGLNLKITKIKIMDARTEMVKRRDKNCTSPNIEDCYINVLEEIPPVTMNLYTLAGPELTDEYETRTEKVLVEKRKAGSLDVPIVCEKNRSKSLVRKVQSQLVKKGYPLQINGSLDQATMLSIVDFQREQKLAYGDLTLETLAALGVK